MRCNYELLFYDLQEHLEDYFDVKTILKYDSEDACYYSLSTIIINKNNPWKHRFYALVHELGHIIIDDDKKEKYFAYPIQDSTKFTRKNAIALVTEEADAWKYGRKYIQEKLNVDLDKDYYDKLKTNCLMSYIVESLQKVYGKQINLNCVKTDI